MSTTNLFPFVKKMFAACTVFIVCININVFAQTDADAVKKVLNAYNAAMQKLDTTGTAALFADSSLIVESGSVEGTYQHYEAHHIGPELGEFKAFTFSGYKVNVTVDGDYAFATEEFKYKIVLKENDKIIERNAVTTAVLKKLNGDWKITVMHFSSRK